MTASDTSRPAEMAKAYESQQVEQRLYDWWERSGFFKADIDPNRKPFTMSMPPPNVTGELHMGHAMFVTIEDVIVRWKSMVVEGQKRGHTFGQPDLFIAAIAAVEDLVVVTRDTAEFVAAGVPAREA